MRLTAEQKRRRDHERDLQRLRDFRPIDDDFMRCMFKDNIPLVQMVLRIILGKEDLTILRCDTQADMKRVTGARSLCLDAYATDSAGKKYDIEIQRADIGAGAHRARYHSSVMDVENLDAGQEFDELPDTYTIFITEKDFFGEGEPLYFIERVNRTTGRPFEDGAYILYVNGEYRGENDIGRLMHDFCCSEAGKMHHSLMSERARYLKEHPEGVSTMCKAIEDMRREAAAEAWEEGREEGMAIGREEGVAIGEKNTAIKTAKKMLTAGRLSFEEIADFSDLPLAQVQELAEELNEST